MIKQPLHKYYKFIYPIVLEEDNPLMHLIELIQTNLDSEGVFTIHLYNHFFSKDDSMDDKAFLIDEFQIKSFDEITEIDYPYAEYDSMKGHRSTFFKFNLRLVDLINNNFFQMLLNRYDQVDPYLEYEVYITNENQDYGLFIQTDREIDFFFQKLK